MWLRCTVIAGCRTFNPPTHTHTHAPPPLPVRAIIPSKVPGRDGFLLQSEPARKPNYLRVCVCARVLCACASLSVVITHCWPDHSERSFLIINLCSIFQLVFNVWPLGWADYSSSATFFSTSESETSGLPTPAFHFTHEVARFSKQLQDFGAPNSHPHTKNSFYNIQFNPRAFICAVQ